MKRVERTYITPGTEDRRTLEKARKLLDGQRSEMKGGEAALYDTLMHAARSKALQGRTIEGRSRRTRSPVRRTT